VIRVFGYDSKVVNVTFFVFYLLMTLAMLLIGIGLNVESLIIFVEKLGFGLF
jgi:hypothetical protein